MSKPSKQSIINEQQKHISELDMGCDWDEAHLRCWCCGLVRKTDRCHMTPNSLGGSDSPDNFLLMCAECHAESPDVDKEVMLAWLRREHSEMHGDRFIRKVWREVNAACEINQDSIDDESITVDRVKEASSKIRKRTSNHFGVGVSHGTMVYVMQETIKQLGVDVKWRSK